MTALERLREEVSRMEELLSRVANDTGCDLYGAKRHFDRVNAALKAVEDEARWIPVEERLPNDYSEVLISVTTSEGNSKVLSGGIGLRDDGQRVWCFLWERPIPITDENVTHWRPLPKGPGEETK